MISCLLILASRNSQGLPVRKESLIAGESIQIGRSTSCKIYLPDHRVSLLHATIKRSEDGALRIEGENNTALDINGSIAPSAALSPGTCVKIGPYSLVAEFAPDGHDIALSIEMPQVPPEQDIEKTCRTTPVTLASLGLSKRNWGLGLAAGILFTFLFLPMLPSASPTFDKWQSMLPISLTESWSPGPLTGGHVSFEAKCSTCHQHAFRPVSDEVCVGCHKQVAQHLAKDDLQASVFKNVRCSDCHQDHKGDAGLVLHNSSVCVACHGGIKSKNTSTKLTDVQDFGKDHPPFHITMRADRDVARIRQDVKEKPIEKPGLKYSHQVHLNKKGISTPQGVTVMVCRDCHRIEESGIHFAPMTMKNTCQQSRCHKLYFTEPVDGVVPHGSEQKVMDRLRDYYARWLASSLSENRASCSQTKGTGNLAERTLECADDLAREYAAATLFKKEGKDLECAVCHEIEPTGDNQVPWKVETLHITRDWQPGAVFVHTKHDTVDCTECHDKMNSKTSADIAMPTIEKCRECHGGNQPEKKQIRSTCDSCHRFHQGAKRADRP